MTRRTQPRHLLGLVALVLAAAVASSTLTAAAGDSTFRDVPPGHPFFDEIAFTADSGIAEGFADGSYRPGQPVSRQAMAAFLQRAQSHRVIAAFASDNNTFLTKNVPCDRPDHVAISGGAIYQGAGRAFIAASGPGAGNGWTVTMATDDGILRNMSMTAFAVCVPGSRVQQEGAD